MAFLQKERENLLEELKDQKSYMLQMQQKYQRAMAEAELYQAQGGAGGEEVVTPTGGRGAPRKLMTFVKNPSALKAEELSKLSKELHNG